MNKTTWRLMVRTDTGRWVEHWSADTRKRCREERILLLKSQPKVKTKISCSTIFDNGESELTTRVKETLFKAYKAGALSLADICPSCFKGNIWHGKCGFCEKQCGCSFNAVSSSDHCELHDPTLRGRV